MVSVKNGAWFERDTERGFTHLAEYLLQEEVLEACRARGFANTDFAVAGTTSADRVRITVLCSPQYLEQAIDVLRVCLRSPKFGVRAIGREMRQLRRDVLRSLLNPYFRAEVAVSRKITTKNPSVFGSIGFHLRARGPDRQHLLAYWTRLWSCSARDVLVFGVEGVSADDCAQELSAEAENAPRYGVLARREIHDGRYIGTVWQETCYHPLFTLLDTAITLRSEKMKRGVRLLRYNRGEWAGFVFFGKRSKVEQARREIMTEAVSFAEWTEAKNAWLIYAARVTNGADLWNDAKSFDDCTPFTYGEFPIRSFDDLIAAVKCSTFEEFSSYWAQVIGVQD